MTRQLGAVWCVCVCVMALANNCQMTPGPENCCSPGRGFPIFRRNDNNVVISANPRGDVWPRRRRLVHGGLEAAILLLLFFPISIHIVA